MINIILGTLIFGYALYTIVMFVKKSKKEGQCGHCSLKSSCMSKSCNIVPVEHKNIKDKH